MANIVCKMRKLKKPKIIPSLDLTTLKNDTDIQKRYEVEVNNRFQQLTNNDNTAEEDWNLIEEDFQSTAKQLLPPNHETRSTNG